MIDDNTLPWVNWMQTNWSCISMAVQNLTQLLIQHVPLLYLMKALFKFSKSQRNDSIIGVNFNRQSCHSFIHSSHFYSASSSPLLLRGAPDYSMDTVLEFHAEAHRQL